MNFEPQKLFIGLMDFFSVLLPGALLTYAIRDLEGSRNLLAAMKMGESHAPYIFVFSSYLLGHFIFLVGSWLDRPYEKLRKAASKADQSPLPERMTRAQRLVHLPFLLWRAWLRSIFRTERGDVFDRADAVKKRYLGPLGADDTVNPFQWCKLRLAIDKPDALAPVQRFEADSKFFRSLVVVLALMVVARPGTVWTHFVVWIGLLLMALWRYMEQRCKATTQAYWAVLALEAPLAPKAQPDRPTHAGGVVYKKEANGTLVYLLVTATKNPGEWVLPKGHIEPDESPREAAFREVLEETGVVGRIEASIDEIAFEVGGKLVRARFFLMKGLGEVKQAEARAHEWLALEDAIGRATHAQTKALLLRADQLRTPQKDPAPRD